MRLLIVGPPGAGKGTQARILAERRGLDHIASGDLLRENIRAGTALGREAQSYMDRGDLVPDDVMIKAIEARIVDSDSKDFILDGFPRTQPQAEALDDLLERLGLPLDLVICLAVSDEKIIERLGGRRTCPACQRTYHMQYERPQDDERCDEDNTGLVLRADDQPDTIRHRLDVYHDTTERMLDYYADRGLLTSLDGDGYVESVAERVDQAIEARS